MVKQQKEKKKNLTCGSGRGKTTFLLLKEKRKELDVKGTKCIFVGYCLEFKAYKMFGPSTHKVFASRDVIFHEHEDKGNNYNIYERWKILPEVEYHKKEAKGSEQ